MNELKIRIIPAIVLFFSINTFFIWLSTNFYPNNSLGYGIAGGLVTSFCLFYTIKGIQDNEDFTNSITENLRLGTSPIFTLGIITFISFIIFTTYLTILYSNIKENELKEFGKITTGEVIDGYSETDENSFGSYNVTVEYQKNGETIKAFTKVTPSEFKNCYVGKEVSLIYSTKNQNLIDVLGDDSKVETYVKIKNRAITINDLIKTIALDKNQTEKYLNEICYPWKYDVYKKGWFNNEKNLYLIKPTKNSVTYLTTVFSSAELKDELAQLKFTKMDSVENSKNSKADNIMQRITPAEGFYKNDQYGLVIKSTIIGDNELIGIIINIVKI